MTSNINRRGFIGSAVATGVFTIVPRHVLGGAGYVAPSEKITLAHIGMGTQGFNELGGLLADPSIQIVSVCDPNTDSNDYIEWGKHSTRNRIRTYLGNPSWREGDNGCPGGREVGREVVDTYYAKQRGAESFKACSAYADFRELLEKEQDLDAVKVMTPDHLHATVSHRGDEKGQARDGAQADWQPAAGSETGGRDGSHQRRGHAFAGLRQWGRQWADCRADQGRSDRPIARGAQLVEPARVAAVYRDSLRTSRPFPKVWIGTCGWDPRLDRPYHPHYTHTVFRGWYDFGGGSMADMGIYSLWPIFTALELEPPVSAEAWGTHSCSIVDQVSRPTQNDFSYPAACTFHFQFAARGDRPALELFWYDGGMKPRRPEEIEAQDIELPIEGILFVGDQGKILAGFHGQEPRLFAQGKCEPLALTEATLPCRARPQRAPQPVDGRCQGRGPVAGQFS